MFACVVPPDILLTLPGLWCTSFEGVYRNETPAVNIWPMVDRDW